MEVCASNTLLSRCLPFDFLTDDLPARMSLSAFSTSSSHGPSYPADECLSSHSTAILAPYESPHNLMDYGHYLSGRQESRGQQNKRLL